MTLTPIKIYVTTLQDDISTWIDWMQAVAVRYPTASVTPIDSRRVTVSLPDRIWHPMDAAFWNDLADNPKRIAHWGIHENPEVQEILVRNHPEYISGSSSYQINEGFFRRVASNSDKGEA